MKMKLKKPKGNLDIFAEVHTGQKPDVVILGDPDGLRHLADLLYAMADVDQETTSAPNGTREHIHIHPKQHLGPHSCEVEICKSDAKGTGKLHKFRKRSRRTTR